MVRFLDVLDGLRKQAFRDVEEIRNTGVELEGLRSAYQRYRDLMVHLNSRMERIKVTLGLLAEQKKDVLDSAGVALENPKDIRESTSLWKMIREVVRQTEELRIVELENIMSELKVKTSRQALEAAIDAHKRTFKITRSGREKFVSLKQ